MQLQRACKCHVQLRSQIPFFFFQKISYIVYCISRISLYKSMYMQVSIHFLETNSAVLILSKIFIMHSALHTIAQGYIIYSLITVLMHVYTLVMGSQVARFVVVPVYTFVYYIPFWTAFVYPWPFTLLTVFQFHDEFLQTIPCFTF